MTSQTQLFHTDRYRICSNTGAGDRSPMLKLANDQGAEVVVYFDDIEIVRDIRRSLTWYINAYDDNEEARI